MPLQLICFAVAALMLTATTAMAGSHGKPKQAMFKTQAEAEAAAPGFGCTGAHQMGEMWMVCDKHGCLLYTSPSPRDRQKSRMPSSA